jgi:hypothetical protein
MQINLEGIENLFVAMVLKKDTNLKRHFFILYFEKQLNKFQFGTRTDHNSLPLIHTCFV